MKSHSEKGVIAGLVAGTIYGITARFIAENRFIFGVFAVMTFAFLLVVPVVVGYLTVRPHPNPSWLYRLSMPWIPMLLAMGALRCWVGKARSAFSWAPPCCSCSPRLAA